jgi:hypothetical protein
MRRAGLVLLLACSSCATQNRSVEQRMLMPPSAARYQMEDTQLFLMPIALHADPPDASILSGVQSLAPTTLCAELIVTADGGVEGVAPLADSDPCAAADAGALSLMRQRLEAHLSGWRFEPAAICQFADAQAKAQADGTCIGEGVQRTEVAVRLAYAFTFEVRNGRRRMEAARLLER